MLSNEEFWSYVILFFIVIGITEDSINGLIDNHKKKGCVK